MPKQYILQYPVGVQTNEDGTQISNADAAMKLLELLHTGGSVVFPSEANGWKLTIVDVPWRSQPEPIEGATGTGATAEVVNEVKVSKDYVWLNQNVVCDADLKQVTRYFNGIVIDKLDVLTVHGEPDAGVVFFLRRRVRSHANNRD